MRHMLPFLLMQAEPGPGGGAAPPSDPPPAPTPPADPGPGPVPYARFQEVIAQRDALQEKAEGYDQVAAERTSLAARVADLEGQVEATKATAAEDLQLYALGMHDDVTRRAIRSAHASMPEEQRGGSLVDWIQSHRAAPDQAPAILRPFVAPPPAAPPAVPPQPPTDRSPPHQPPTGGGVVTGDALAQARDHGKRTGDWSRYDALKQAYRDEQNRSA